MRNRQTDRRTDGQTEFSSLDRVCISCSAVKIVAICYAPGAGVGPGGAAIQTNTMHCYYSIQIKLLYNIEINLNIENVAIAMHCNLKAAATSCQSCWAYHNAPAYKFNTFATYFRVGDTDFLSFMDILAFTGIFGRIFTARSLRVHRAELTINHSGPHTNARRGPFILLPSASLLFPPIPLEVGHLNPVRRSGERCSLPQRDLERSPS